MADANNDRATGAADTKAAASATASDGRAKTSAAPERPRPAGKSAGRKPQASAHAASRASADSQDGDLSADVQSTVNSLLDEKTLNSRRAPGNVRNLMRREKDNNRRVQDTIKNAKTNPKWFVPLFVSLLIIGLAWVIVYYATSQSGPGWPIPAIGNWNLLIGFLIMLAGFIMTMWWN